MSDLGTVTVLVFSRALGWPGLRYPAVRPLRAITASTDLDGSTGRRPGLVDPEASVSLHSGTGILTSFPFVRRELRTDLGSANPRLTNSAEEPLLVRPSGFLPDYRCYYGQDFRH